MQSLEYALKNFSKEKKIEFINANPKKTEELFRLAIKDTQPYSARAAWLLTYCSNEIITFDKQKKILHVISKFKDGQQRDLLHVMLQSTVAKALEGPLYNFCVEVWCKPTKKPSVRYYAFLIVLKTFKNYPELKNEMELLTQKQYIDTLSPGVKKSILKLIKGANL